MGGRAKVAHDVPGAARAWARAMGVMERSKVGGWMGCRIRRIVPG